MGKNSQQDTIRGMMDAMKGDYKTPGKALLWGMAVWQWTGIIVVGGILLALFISFVFSRFPSSPENMSRQVAVIKELTAFLKISACSINDRKADLERLTETINKYKGISLNQKEIEEKIESLASNLSSCNASRGHYLKMFARVMNPFETPGVSEGFNELIGYNSAFEKHTIDPQEENNRWKELCKFCQNELNKAHEELAYVLNAGANAQKQ